MLNANNHWEIIEAAYQNLGATDDAALDPSTLEDYDYEVANDETMYHITNAPQMDIALLTAYARQGYLDDDNEIWEAIGQACRRALEKVARERWEDYLEEQAADADEDDDTEE